MSVWDWVFDYRDEAMANGDDERVQLSEYNLRAHPYTESSPETALGIYEEGRQHAVRLAEPHWVLFYDHWRLQTYLHFLQDYRPVLDIAVQATLEARKPMYQRFPQRICLHEDLIWGYLGIDPIGYQDAIEQALDFMETETTEDLECRYCVKNCRADFEVRRGRLDRGELAAREVLSLADDEPVQSTAEHHGMSAYNRLCEIAFQRGDWESVWENARIGEELARRRQRNLNIAKALLWQALASRHLGNNVEAGRLFRASQTVIRQVKAVPSPSYFDALCDYHETGGHLDLAVQSRRHELQQIGDRGRLHDETRCRVKLCRLLARARELSTPDLESARACASKLRDPSSHIAELETIERERR
jgi:hypothetical protein